MSKREERAEKESLILKFIEDRANEHAQKLYGEKGRKISFAMAREQLFLDMFRKETEKLLSKGLVKPSGYALRKNRGYNDRVVNVALSDLHFQSLLDPREVPIPFGPQEEARRIAKVGVEVAEYKLQYRDETTLNVYLLGDIIQGKLHDVQEPSGPITQQFAAAVYLLTQLLAFWGKHFKKVNVYCTPGNHGRNTARHKDRATSQKWDSIENMIYFSIKMAVSNHKNIEVSIPYTPYFIADLFGAKLHGTHGDTVIDPGYPNHSIQVKKVREQINEWNSSDTVEHCKVFVVGHVHTASITHLDNGAVFITNGPLIPSDPYGLSKGHTSSNCGQWVWESVKGHAVGDSRYVQVNKDTDKDASLDKVIKPFQSL